MRNPRTVLLLCIVWMLAVGAVGCNRMGGSSDTSATATALALTVESELGLTSPDATPEPADLADIGQTPDAPPLPPPTACANSSAIDDDRVDVTVPDNTEYAAGTAFSKTWRLRNDGACTWTTAYTFVPIDTPAQYVDKPGIAADPLGSPAAVSLPHEVPPGAEVEIAVDGLVAPSAPGTYRAYWQLTDSAGVAFGRTPYVQIVVTP